MNFKRLAYLSGCFSLAAFAGSALYAQQYSDTFLSSLNKGLWKFDAPNGEASRAAQSQICVGDATKLIQIQHGDANCEHRILASNAKRLTVSYSCRGLGQGITTIRRETDKLVQISSQGIRNGSPFNFEVEGRRLKTC